MAKKKSFIFGYHRLFHMTDWLPTFLSAIKSGRGNVAGAVGIDGVDQWGSFQSDMNHHARSEILQEGSLR